MTDIQDFQFDRPKESYEAYLRRRAIEHGDLSAQRQLDRAELRASERGFLEALTTTANGRDRSFSDLLGFVGTANEAIYLNEIRKAREAMDAGNATVAQRKMYERWEDFSVRSSSWWAHVGDIAAQAPAFMQEMAAGGVAGGLARGAVSQLGKTGLRKTLLGRTAAAISRPVRKFDAGLANVIQRSAQAAQGTAAATP